MRNLKMLTIATLVASSLIACSDRHSESPSSAAESEASAVSGTGEIPTQSAPLELLPTGGSAEAFPIAPGSYVTGGFKLKQAGQFSGVLVQIGNYNNTSDGVLAVELCRQQDCVKGTKPLTGSIDNGYLEIPLATRFNAAADSVVTYRFTKLDGSVPVALWLYPVAGDLTAIRANDGDEVPRTPRLALRK